MHTPSDVAHISPPPAAAAGLNVALRLAARGGLAVQTWLAQPVSARKGRRGGVALMMVLAYILIMTALVVAHFQNNLVSLSIASNARDDIKAFYKARSALNLSRLILAFQYDLEKDPDFARIMQNSQFQIYQITDLLMEPFKTGAVALQGAGEESIASYDLQGGGTTGLGDEAGDYTVQITPEEGRININRFAGSNSKVALFDICLLVAPKEYDDLFDDNGGEHKHKAERLDMISALVDWVDTDQDKTSLNKRCEFEGAGGDEAGVYEKAALTKKQRYEPKNAKFTTLDELYLVHGITDDFMAQFRDSLTVYPIDKVNVNIATGRVLYAVLCNAVSSIGGQPIDPNTWACNDPNVSMVVLLLASGLEGYQQFVNTPMLLLSYYLQGNPEVIEGVTPRGTVVPFRRPNEFRKVLTAMQTVPILVSRFLIYSPTAYQLLPDPSMLDASQLPFSLITFDDRKLYNDITTDGPKIFRVTTTGSYNGTVKTLTAVLDFRVPGGKFLYWREF